ncbi:MAG: Dihydroorotate dehydrogenase B (NAD(+)), electron transfer subunit [Pelotomaculum sp. PtaB.Bin104]|nr:MAG: Dihydroorotate dehydrogenase B (NAD(+)), electron transfer subunit [Pelotomaculum sp. PtaB.Bin104]
MTLLVDAKVTKQERIAPSHYRLSLLVPEIAAEARPGQFLQVRCGSTLDPFLRRPISIHAVDRKKGVVAILYRVAGRGTALLAEKIRGNQVSLLGPLGKGFSMPENQARVSVVSGGIGVAPLYFLLAELAESSISADVFLGAATADQLFLAKEITGLGHRVYTATDDGSTGYHGLVTELFVEIMTHTDPPKPHLKGQEGLLNDPFESIIDNNRYAMIYGCGPGGMLRRLTEIVRAAGIPGEISLEERMGCGVGACLSCVCKTSTSEESIQYSRVCTEGPVFPAVEVVWS